MPSWRKHAVCGLVLTGTLSTAAAQPPHLVPVPAPTAPSANSAASPADARAAEIAVELAWLGEAATFPYPLRAQFKNGALELHGRVPTGGLKVKAVALAKEAALLQVSDQIVVQANMALLLPTLPDDSFTEEAKARFFSIGRSEGRQIELKTTRDGKLFVAGYAVSAEEKLAYSRVFRGLVGCRLVRNELVVGTLPPVVAVQDTVPNGTESAGTTEAPPRPEPPKLMAPEHVRMPALAAPVKRDLPGLQPPVKAHSRLNKDGTEPIPTAAGKNGGTPTRVIFD